MVIDSDLVANLRARVDDDPVADLAVDANADVLFDDDVIPAEQTSFDPRGRMQ